MNNYKMRKIYIEKQYINVRVESVSEDKNEELIRHCLRSKKEKRAIKQSKNVMLSGPHGRWEFYRYEDNEDMESRTKHYTNLLLKHNKEIVEKQKKILKKHGKYLNRKKTNQVLSGIITFSNSIQDFNDEDMMKIEKAAQNFIKEMCQNFKTELHYLVFHKDESGLPHFHFSVDNFDNETGLTFYKTKEFGSKLQDLAAKYFEEFGFMRGEKKEKNFNRKHLSIEEYKIYKDTLKKNQEVLEENQKLKEENERYKEINENLKKSHEKMRAEFMEIIEDIEEFITEKDKVKKTKKWQELWQRYEKNDNKDRQETLLNKARKFKDKLNRRKTDKNTTNKSQRR